MPEKIPITTKVGYFSPWIFRIAKPGGICSVRHPQESRVVIENSTKGEKENVRITPIALDNNSVAV